MSAEVERANTSADRPPGTPPAGHDASRPRLDSGKLRAIKLKELALRFAFGGTLSVLAALIAHLTSLRFGGLFTAFPVVMLASLTLIGQHDGDEPSAEDAQGGVVGACALLASAALLALALPRVPGVVALGAALVGWSLLGVLLYLLAVKVGWLRTSRDEDEHRTQR